MERKKTRIFAAGAFAALALAGCESKPDNPGPAELALVTGALDASLNAPLVAARKVFKDANSDQRVFTYELRIQVPGGTLPVDWWLWDQGFMKVASSTLGVGFFNVTPEGEAYLAAPSASWLKASFKGTPNVLCAQAGSWSHCQVTGTASIAPAPGAGKLASPTAPDLPFDAQLNEGPQGWSVDSIKVTSGRAASVVGNQTIFGDEETILAKQKAFGAKADKQLR